MKNIKKIMYICMYVSIFMILSSTKCYRNVDTCHQIIHTKNLSNKKIIAYSQIHSELSDTTWGSDDPFGGHTGFEIEVHKNGAIYGDCWEKENIIRLFIFDYFKASFTETGIHKTHADYDSIVLVRYDLMSKDLINLNWQISYPPPPAMKDIKMYPPYNEVKNNE